MREFFHRKIERTAIGFVVAIVAVASIGGFVEIAPLFTIHKTVEEVPDMRTYTPLELAGRDIYIREGCYACHSQMIRTLRDEVERYGPYSLAVESKYDHPMLWGSKRTGPDLARLGGKYSDAWHVAHLINPRDVVPQSIMPKYGWLQRNELDIGRLGLNLAAQRTVGVPYTQDMIDNAAQDAYGQATPDTDAAAGVAKRYGAATNVRAFDGDPGRVTEMDALVAYLQVLGHLTDAAYKQAASAGAAENPVKE
jgi:cytochrome c oxidase cbb3-type subunit 2